MRFDVLNATMGLMLVSLIVTIWLPHNCHRKSMNDHNLTFQPRFHLKLIVMASNRKGASSQASSTYKEYATRVRFSLEVEPFGIEADDQRLCLETWHILTQVLVP